MEFLHEANEADFYYVLGSFVLFHSVSLRKVSFISGKAANKLYMCPLLCY